MAQRTPRVGSFMLAALVAAVLWLVAHGQSDIDRPVDIPIVFSGIPDNLVITEQSVDVVNIRVLGSRAALRDVSPTKLKYEVQVAGSKPGPAIYEVDDSRIQQQLPGRARIVSRSPARIEVEFERRGRKAVRVRPDIEGEPAEGFALSGFEVDPPRVWLQGARSTVLRLSEVVTETIDVSGLREPVEREVRLSLGGGPVWREQNDPVTVRLQVDPIPPPEEAADAVESNGGGRKEG